MHIISIDHVLNKRESDKQGAYARPATPFVCVVEAISLTPPPDTKLVISHTHQNQHISTFLMMYVTFLINEKKSLKKRNEM